MITIRIFTIISIIKRLGKEVVVNENVEQIGTDVGCRMQSFRELARLWRVTLPCNECR